MLLWIRLRLWLFTTNLTCELNVSLCVLSQFAGCMVIWTWCMTVAWPQEVLLWDWEHTAAAMAQTVHVNGNGPGNIPLCYIMVLFSSHFGCVWCCSVFCLSFCFVKLVFFSAGSLLVYRTESSQPYCSRWLYKVGCTSMTSLFSPLHCWLIIIYFYMWNDSWLPHELYVLILTNSS